MADARAAFGAAGLAGLRRLAGLRHRVARRPRRRLRVRVEGLTLEFVTEAPAARRWFYPRYARGEPHEPAVSRLVLAHLHRDAVFLDVGAHLGYFTLLAAKVCTGPRAGSHAFEMDPALLPLIERSLARNAGLGPVHLVCAAAAERSGAIVGFAPAQAGNRSTNRVVPRAGAGVQAVTLALDDYCALRGVAPTLIKLDVEGAEALAVAGMQETLRRQRPALLLELHPRELPHFGATPESVIDAIACHDYEIAVVPDHRAPAGAAPEPLARRALPADRPVVLLCRPRPPAGGLAS